MGGLPQVKGFPFSIICTLLQRLEDLENRNFLLIRDKNAEVKKVIESWFKSHRGRINDLDVEASTALLSTLLPEWRTDRVYYTQTATLSKTIGRGLHLSIRSKKILEAYKSPGFGDLGTCLEQVLKDLGDPAIPVVTLEEVDDLLQVWAGLCSFSDPSVTRLPASSSRARDEKFGNILKRLEAQQGKWLVRLILKNFSPVRIDEGLILKNFHFLLPDILRFQRNFHTAVGFLKKELRQWPDRPDPRSEHLLRTQADDRIGVRPIVGTKVSRPKFNKAWSIDSCLKMLGNQSWVVERKYDGEYCEIHVDISRSPDPAECIQIFSKSGKESRADKTGVIPTLVQCLRLGKSDCRIKKQAILLGELVVYSDEEDCILPFGEIRKHVTRSGRRIGNDADSQPKHSEHLAMVFFDLLLLDEEIVMRRPVEERRMWLREVYKKIQGRSMSAEWKQIDFSITKSKKRLLDQFAASNARRCEGLVLKPCGVPYFSLEASNRSFIKLKKDYIMGMGDECDFAVIGGSYNAQLAGSTGIRNIKWTTFHLGCLMNREDVRRIDARPVFKVVGTVDCEHCIPKAVLEAAHSIATFVARPYAPNETPIKFDLRSEQPLKMDHIFDTPFVFEVLGSGYEKPSNCNFLMLRHPRAKKLHEDRTWEDCVTFQELQEQGKASTAAPVDSESQETRRWIDRLERSCKEKFERERTASPRSRRTFTPTGSVVGLSQRSSPVKPSARRSINALPTPLPSSGVALSSPPRQAPVLERTKAANKRRQEESPECPQAKKLRLCQANQVSSRQLRTPPSSAVPLVEISSNADSNSAQISARTSRYSAALSNITSRLAPIFRQNPRQDSHFDVAASVSACGSSRCTFSNSTVYLVPCIQKTPYITEDLLGMHDVAITSNIMHWDRDSFAHEPLADIVSESQAYLGMRKIVLVERKRRNIVQNVVKSLLRLNINNGGLRERIEVYDWRVLEECQEHEKGADLLKEHFIGATLFDDTQQRTLFVSECDWLQ